MTPPPYPPSSPLPFPPHLLAVAVFATQPAWRQRNRWVGGCRVAERAVLFREAAEQATAITSAEERLTIGEEDYKRVPTQPTCSPPSPPHL